MNLIGSKYNVMRVSNNFIKKHVMSQNFYHSVNVKSFFITEKVKYFFLLFTEKVMKILESIK